MKKRLNADTINVNGKTVNVGIDVHKLSWHITALVEGVIVESATFTRDPLLQLLIPTVYTT